ncbi:hypothetical protein GCM10010230_44980 [Streptomyces narbonensis]|nr:hypothetical protein GCM10010230_44980 [Streptomyces narbonensis]
MCVTAADGGENATRGRYGDETFACDLSHSLLPAFSALALSASKKRHRAENPGRKWPPAPECMARTPGPDRLTPSRGEAQRQALTQVLPKAGFSRPITETVLPHTFTGT